MAHLVIGGRLGWDYDDLLARSAFARRSAAGVHLVGYVAQRDLPAVYAGSSLFVYPSLQEGSASLRSRRWPAACR